MSSKNKCVNCKREFNSVGRGVISSSLSLLNKVVPIGSVVNRAIDALPIELHIPGYNYCGPGTKLAERLSRGDPGINKLDDACKEHDIAYSKYKDSGRRSVADKALAEKAWQRVRSSDASLVEKAAALAIAATMGAKSKIGGGRKKRKSKKRNTKGSGVHKTGRGKCCSKKRQRKVKKKNGRGMYLKPYRNVY